LRKSLGENRGAPQYIETLPKRGYRFIANVREVEETGPADGGEKSQPQQADARQRRLAILVFAGLLLIAAGFALSPFLPTAGPRPLQFTPLVVDSTLKLFPAWSPNGRTVAYAGEADGKLQIFT